MAELSDHTHSELQLLYQNATSNIDFCKKQQWWLTVQIITVYAVLVLGVDQFVGVSEKLIDTLIIIGASFLAGFTSYLIWATHCSGNAERDRLDFIETRFSLLFGYARSRKKVSPAQGSRQIALEIMTMQLVITWIGWGLLWLVCWNYPALSI